MNKAKIHEDCQRILDEYTSDPQKVPGVVFAAIDKHGDFITTTASGHRSLGGDKPMDADTTFWIASFTKMLTAIVCMQLVEQGKVKLDDPTHLYKYCPELETVKVLQHDGTLVDRKNDITLRMLLAHTAGFGYEFFNERLRDHLRPIGCNVFDCVTADFVDRPLVNQPGERWEYGTSIDWAGIYCERVTGQGLNDLMQQGFIKPLGLESTTMFPTKAMKANLASMHQRWPGSTSLHVTAHTARAQLRDGADQMKWMIQSGGAGMFSKPTDYLQILATLLNDGVSPKTGARVLTADSVKEMFTNQVPQFPDWSRTPIPAALPTETNPIPDLSLTPGPQAWGLSLQLVNQGVPGGRSAGTGNWAGIANLYYLVDRQKGVAAMIASQILPFADMGVMEAFGRCEQALYAGL